MIESEVSWYILNKEPFESPYASHADLHDDMQGVLKSNHSSDLQYVKQGDPHTNTQVNYQGYPWCNQQGYPQPYKG